MVWKMERKEAIVCVVFAQRRFSRRENDYSVAFFIYPGFVKTCPEYAAVVVLK